MWTLIATTVYLSGLALGIAWWQHVDNSTGQHKPHLVAWPLLVAIALGIIAMYITVAIFRGWRLPRMRQPPDEKGEPQEEPRSVTYDLKDSRDVRLGPTESTADVVLRGEGLENLETEGFRHHVEPPALGQEEEEPSEGSRSKPRRFRWPRTTQARER